MKFLVVDRDRKYAATPGQILTSLKCQVDIGSTTNETVARLDGKRSDRIFM